MRYTYSEDYYVYTEIRYITSRKLTISHLLSMLHNCIILYDDKLVFDTRSTISNISFLLNLKIMDR